MIHRRILSAAVALAVSAISLVVVAAKTKEDILSAESKKKNRTYRIKKEG